MRIITLGVIVATLVINPAYSISLNDHLCSALAAEKLPQIPSMQVVQIDVDHKLIKTENYRNGYWETKISTKIGNQNILYVFNCIYNPPYNIVVNLDRIE